MHARSVSCWVSAVKDVLVELSCEVACEPMDLTLILTNSENLPVVLLHSLAFVLRNLLQLGIVRVRNVPEGEHFLSFSSAWEGSRVDPNNVRQLERVHLLGDWHS